MEILDVRMKNVNSVPAEIRMVLKYGVSKGFCNSFLSPPYYACSIITNVVCKTFCGLHMKEC